MRFPRRTQLAALLLVLPLSPVLLLGQSSAGGAITGQVYDPSGRALAGLSVSAESADERYTRATHTGAHGSFVLSELMPGVWHVSIRSGNGPPVQYDVTVAVAATSDLGMVGLDPLLPAFMETVDVSANPLLQTQSAESGAVIRPEEIDNLPVNQRRWQDFTLLTPAAVLDPETGGVSFHGAPSTQNIDALDGADDTESFAPGDNTRSRLDAVVSQAAVREFHTLTAGYSSLHGRAGGAEVDTITRSGTEHLHGEALYLARDSRWSNEQPDTAVLLPGPDGTLLPQTTLPRDWRQQGSGRVGGPILRDRAFWHATVDREHRSFPAIATVTDSPGLFFSQALPGDLSGFQPQGADCGSLVYLDPGNSTRLRGTGSETTAALYGTQGACYLNLFDSTVFPNYASAAAAYDNGLAYLYSLTGRAARARDTTFASGQIDASVLRSHVAFSYNVARSSSLGGAESQPFVARSVTSLGNDSLRDGRGRVEVDTPFLAFINTLRAGYGSSLDAQTAQTPLPQEPLTALDQTASPGVAIGRQFLFGTPAQLDRPQYPAETRTQVYDAVEYTRGRLTVQAGGELQHVEDTVAELYADAGEFHYSNVQDFLIDLASAGATPAERCGVSGDAQHLCFSRFVQGFGTRAVAFASPDYAVFGQLQARLAAQFVVSGGVRLQSAGLPAGAFAYSAGGAALPSRPGQTRVAPNAGVAWHLLPSTVVRAGGGVYFGRAPASAVYRALSTAPENGTPAQQIYTLTSQADAPRYPNVLAASPAQAVAAPDVTTLSSHFKRPESLLFSVEAEQALGGLRITAGGVAALGREFPIVIDTNLNAPSGTEVYEFAGGPLDGKTLTTPVYAGARPQPALGSIRTVESRANERYLAFTLQGEQGAAHGLTLRASYTYSAAIDDGQHSTVSGVSNQVLSPADFAPQRGTASLDRPQRLAAAAVYEPRFATGSRTTRLLANGWLAAPVLQVASGVPYSARLLGDVPGAAPEYRTSYGYNGSGGDDFLPALGRNAFRQPYTAVLDMRAGRSIALPHEARLQVFAEAFNLLNRTNLSGYGGRPAVDDTAYQVGSGQTPGQPAVATFQPAFGTRVEEDAAPLFSRRQLQLGARLAF